MKGYRVISISLYDEDEELLNQHVEKLKQRDGTSARWSKSALIQQMIRNLDTRNVPRRRKP